MIIKNAILLLLVFTKETRRNNRSKNPNFQCHLCILLFSSYFLLNTVLLTVIDVISMKAIFLQST